jgi:hypothetical protein
MARVTRDIVPYRDGGPFEWRRYADEPAGDVIVAHGLRDETFRLDVDRAFRNLHKPSNLQGGLNADMVDGKDASAFVGVGPGGGGPQCNAMCFGPPDPDNPDDVTAQDSGWPTSAGVALAGGGDGEVLTKQSSGDYDYAWEPVPPAEREHWDRRIESAVNLVPDTPQNIELNIPLEAETRYYIEAMIPVNAENASDELELQFSFADSAEIVTDSLMRVQYLRTGSAQPDTRKAVTDAFGATGNLNGDNSLIVLEGTFRTTSQTNTLETLVAEMTSGGGDGMTLPAPLWVHVRKMNVA